jgi:hypothetical protein
VDKRKNKIEHTNTPVKRMEVMGQREMLQRKNVENADQKTQKYAPLINVLLCEAVSTIKTLGRSSIVSTKDKRKKEDAPSGENTVIHVCLLNTSYLLTSYKTSKPNVQLSSVNTPCLLTSCPQNKANKES